MFRLFNKNVFDFSNRGMSKILVRNKSQTQTTSKLIFSSESIENTQNIRRNESVLFNDTYNQVLADLNSNPFKCKQFSKANEWLKRVMDYNVPHGKRNRGLSLVITYHLLASDHERNDQNLHNARVLGWCVELFQAYFLIIDDIMDHSITRRGQLCWYKKDSVGLMACNDAALLESGIYYLIKMYFKDKPFYLNLIELMLEIFRITAYGQCIDLLSKPEGMRPDLSTYTIDKYSAIVKYKTSYYSFVLPLRLALYLSNWTSKKDHDIVEQISLKIGHLFQAQDDYLDCFGDSFITGKIGTDIEDGKCCWPIVTALNICDQQQRGLLDKHYGRKEFESVKQVKHIYYELNLENLFKEYENNAYNEILQIISGMSHITDLPTNIFNEPLSQVYRRNK